VALSIAMAHAAAADLPECAPDAVVAGTICLDKYEASVWRVPNPANANASVVAKILHGSANRGDLTAAGASSLGASGDDYAPCADDGQSGCGDIYAVSIPSVVPAAFATWFQAQEACANSGKRLPTNAEWQSAASGTPDPGPDNGTTDCNTASGALPRTGERARCVSSRGAFDMVGGVAEWTAEWLPAETACPGWASFSNDEMCLAGASATSPSPVSPTRGGAFASLGGTNAGPFAIHPFAPFHSASFIGFRCAR
jgi:hypothetical protein